MPAVTSFFEDLVKASVMPSTTLPFLNLVDVVETDAPPDVETAVEEPPAPAEALAAPEA